jgi:hypothetical protein
MQQKLSLDDLCSNIAAALPALKQLDERITGYRFLYSGRATFECNNGLMIAGINPGNESDSSDRFFTTDGRNAYLTETWRGPRFQPEMLAFMYGLFSELGTSEPDIPRAFDETLMSNLIPFRSARFGPLSADVKRHLRGFAKDLWAAALPQTNVRAIICCGEETYDGFASVRASSDALRGLTLVRITHAASKHWDLTSNLGHAVRVLRNASFSFQAKCISMMP